MIFTIVLLTLVIADQQVPDPVDLVEECHGRLEESREALREISLEGSVTVTTYLGWGNPDGSPSTWGPGQPMPKPYLLPTPAVSSANWSIAKSGERSLSVVTPLVQDELHRGRSLDGTAVYQRDGNELKVYEEASKTVRVDEVHGKQGLLERPLDLFVVTDVFEYHLTPEWPRFYASLEEPRLSQGEVSRDIQRVREGGRDMILVRDRYQHPVLVGRDGQLTVERHIRYSTEQAIQPVNIRRYYFGALTQEVEIEWAEHAGVLLPAKVIFSRWVPEGDQRGAKMFLLDRQELTVKVAEAQVGRQVQDSALNFEPPVGTKVFKLAATETPSGSIDHHSHRDWSLAVALSLILLFVGGYYYASRRRRHVA